MLLVPLRNYWPVDLAMISTNQNQSLKSWLFEAKDYRIHSDISNNSFDLTTYNREDFLKPMSCDINRFMRATIETIVTNSTCSISPKSTPWILIQSYYASFYAINTILRLLGNSLSYLDRKTCNKIQKIAHVYGHQKGIQLSRGLYKISYNTNTSVLKGVLLSSSNGGAHELSWSVFLELIQKIQNELSINYGTIYSSELAKIRELELNLTSGGLSNGSWLSTIRNQINYQQMHGVWFPYTNRKFHHRLINTLEDWKYDPINIDLKTSDTNLIIKFSSTCQFIISWAIAISNDMKNRIGVNRSFHKYGVHNTCNQI